MTIEELATPAIVVDLDILENEAAVMGEAGLDDILVHYPVLVPGKAVRLAQLAHDCKVTVAVDSLVTAQALSAAALAAVQTPDEMESLVRAISKLPHVDFAGITTYPGHIWFVPDEQRPALESLRDGIAQMLEAVARIGLECTVVSAGSTPTAYNRHLVRGLTEIPGTYVFNDRTTMGVGACTLDQCALRVLVTVVVSNAVPGRAVVDGRSKTFCSDRWLSGPPQSGRKFSVIPNVEGHWNVAARGMVR